MESLNIVYSRSHMNEEDFISLVSPMLRPGWVKLLQELYQWSIVDPSDINDNKYTLAKKLSEVCIQAHEYIAHGNANVLNVR